MNKIKFNTIEEGLKILEKEYLFTPEACSGEQDFINELLEDIEENFDTETMTTTLLMSTIQEFRALHCHDDNEVFAEIDMHEEEIFYQDYVYYDGTPVAHGTRIGVERLINNESPYLDLDLGILYA